MNANSWASLTVANEFIALRKIPPVNVLYIDWNGGFESTDGDTFRTKILAPALSALGSRAIYDHIDYIIYSSDFPYAIGTGKDYPETLKLPTYATPAASVNSATYFWNLVMAKQPMMYDLNINQYMRGFLNLQHKIDRQTAAPTHGFHAWYGWGAGGALLEAGGQPDRKSVV